jgi:hypothetical protein
MILRPQLNLGVRRLRASVYRMCHEPPEMDDSDDELETGYGESVLMAGGVIVGADGIARPLPEHEAIAGAIPQWVLLPKHEADTLDACLGFAAHDHPAVRAAAAAAFGDLVRRYGRLAERERVVRAIELGLRDRDDDVRGAASRSAGIVEAALGWRISRPVV